MALDDGSVQAITSGGITVLSVSADSTSVTVQATDYGVSIASDVSASIKYTLSGTLSGTLTVESDSPYELYMDGLVVNGSDGTLTVSGNYKHGIYSKDYIRVVDGTLNVSVTVRDAIRCVNGFIFDDGDLTITATGETIDDESKGIKVEGSEDSPGEGYVVINGGYVTITSVSKGITASWDVDEDAETASTDDDPDPYVEINNGVIIVTTTGTSYEPPILRGIR